MAWEAGSILELRVEYEANAQKLMNVLHYAPGGVSTGFDVPDMVAGFLALQVGLGNGVLVGELRKLLSTGTTITKVSAQAIYPTRWGVKTEVMSVAGTNVSGPCELQNVQASITKRGLMGNRHNVGGIRIGGLPTSNFDNGLVQAAFLPSLQTFADDFLSQPQADGVSTVEYLPAILNKTKVIVDGKPKYVISGRTIVDSWEVHDEARTQRTRTVGRGI